MLPSILQTETCAEISEWHLTLMYVGTYILWISIEINCNWARCACQLRLWGHSFHEYIHELMSCSLLYLFTGYRLQRQSTAVSYYLASLQVYIPGPQSASIDLTERRGGRTRPPFLQQHSGCIVQNFLLFCFILDSIHWWFSNNMNPAGFADISSKSMTFGSESMQPFTYLTPLPTVLLWTAA